MPLFHIGHTFSAQSSLYYLKSEHRRVAPETVLNYVRDWRESYLLIEKTYVARKGASKIYIQVSSLACR